MQKNIFLVTWYDSINYGTVIQCYALAEFLRKNKYNVFIPNTNKYYYGITHPAETTYNIFCKFITKLKNIKSKNYEFDELYNKRKKKNHEFAIHKTKIYIVKTKKDYKNIINKCNYFLAGSDQIWNPNYIKPTMLLSMAPKNKIKIAYGSSIGVSNIPNKMKSFYKKYINRFDYIGIREKSSLKIINEISDINAKVVVDPSFLLTKKDWEKIAKKPHLIKEKKEFIFCYFIGNAKKHEEEINKFGQNNKLPIYCAMSENKIKYSFENLIIDIGVEEFIWCILNAKYIITDSFHATALSINFNKNFYTYKRFNDNDFNSQNSRIYDLINYFKLNNNLELPENSLNNIRYKINYEKINRVLEKVRKESINFLLNALGDENGNNM